MLTRDRQGILMNAAPVDSAASVSSRTSGRTAVVLGLVLVAAVAIAGLVTPPDRAPRGSSAWASLAAAPPSPSPSSTRDVSSEGTGRLGLRPAVPTPAPLAGAYRFVSAPDFLNQDVADLTRYGIRVKPGTAVNHKGADVTLNSYNDDYRRALDFVLSEMRTKASNLLVAGDLVGGRWGRDGLETGYFGPVRTKAQRRRAIRRAGRVYFRAWQARVAAHGFRAFPAVGDHDIGDDPWSRFKAANVDVWRGLFTDELLRKPGGGKRFSNHAPGQPTSYAAHLNPNVLLVTLDVFSRVDGKIVSRVRPRTMTWLKGVLARAKRDRVPWVVVQGHTPIAGPVRYRFSSALTYDRRTDSELWRVMRRGGVDVYFSGEVHDQSAVWGDGILSITHGSMFYHAEASYLVVEATRDRINFVNQQFLGDHSYRQAALFSTEGGAGPAQLSYGEPSHATGVVTAVRTPGGGIGVQTMTGVFAPIR